MRALRTWRITANPGTANSSNKPRWRVIWVLSGVLFLSCSAAVALALLAPAAAPVRAGSAQDFWDVVLGEKRYRPGDLRGWQAYVTPHGSFLYENWTLESTVLYEAPEADVRSQFKQAVEKLGDAGNSFRPYVLEGFAIGKRHRLTRIGPRSGVVRRKHRDEAQFARARQDQPAACYYHQPHVRRSRGAAGSEPTGSGRPSFLSGRS